MNDGSIEGFEKFHETWTEQLQQLLHHLRSASEHRRAISVGESSVEAAESADEELRCEVGKVMSHCREYHAVRRAAIEADVVEVLASPWSSALERSLQWVGGWRPTTAFHLVYTEASILFENQIFDILGGYRTGDLSDLSSLQFRNVNELQCETVKEENYITDELSEWQDDASDLVMETIVDLHDHLRRLVGIVQRADDLRLSVILGVVSFLSPLQAAEFLTATAELHMGIRGWGMSHDHRGPSHV